MDEHRLNILLIEENKHDVFFLKETLSSITQSYDIDHVEDLENAKVRLFAHKYDLLLLSINLENKNVEETFLEITQYCNSCPIIIISQEDNSELKQNLIMVGASEFLVKSEINVQTLRNSIIKATEKKIRTKSILEDHSIYKNLIEQSNDAIYFLVHGKFEIVNNKFEKMFGYSREEIIDPNFDFFNLISPSSHEYMIERKNRIDRGENVENVYEFTALHKNGDAIECEASVTYVDFNGSVAAQGVIRNITEKKNLEKELLILSSGLESTINGVIITDAKNDIVWTNKAIEELSGYSKEELMNKNPRIFKSGILDENFYKSMWDKITAGEAWESEIINKKKDGTLYTEKMTITPVKNSLGEIVNYIAIKEDISDRIKSRTELERNSLRLEILNELVTSKWQNNRDILTFCLSSIVEITESEIGYIHFINNHTNKIQSSYKFTKSNKEFCQAKDNDDILLNDQIWRDCLLSKKIVVINDSNTLLSDLPLKFSQSITRFISYPVLTFGNVVAIVGICNKPIDYSKTNETELSVIANEMWKLIDSRETIGQLKRSEERFRNLYQNATIGLFQVTPEDKLILGNTKFLEIFGFKSLEEAKKNYTPNKSMFDAQSRKLFFEIIMTEGIIYGFEEEIENFKGEKIIIRESAKKISEAEGTGLYIEGMVEDITEQKNAETSLLIAKEKAEKSDRLKSEFLTQISHEIRTPLNALLSFSSLLKMDLDDKIVDDYLEYFESADRSGNRILRTIDLILDMSQIQTGQYHMHFERFDIVTEVIMPIVKNYKQIAQKKDLKFDFHFNIESKIIHADKESVNKILINLVDNAVKFTKIGNVELSIKLTSVDHLEVEISDTGIGMSDEFKEDIFNLFTQEEQGYTRRYDGNGLGLALVKNLVDMNKIQIYFESEKEKGTKFVLRFNQ